MFFGLKNFTRLSRDMKSIKDNDRDDEFLLVGEQVQHSLIEYYIIIHIKKLL